MTEQITPSARYTAYEVYTIMDGLALINNCFETLEAAGIRKEQIESQGWEATIIFQDIAGTYPTG